MLGEQEYDMIVDIVGILLGYALFFILSRSQLREKGGVFGRLGRPNTPPLHTIAVY